MMPISRRTGQSMINVLAPLRFELPSLLPPCEVRSKAKVLAVPREGCLQALGEVGILKLKTGPLEFLVATDVVDPEILGTVLFELLGASAENLVAPLAQGGRDSEVEPEKSYRRRREGFERLSR